MDPFTVYPAIDLRNGKVVRLAQGDPEKQTIYGDDPGEVARQWIEAGAHWLHIVNLDGAFEQRDSANKAALKEILSHTSKVKIQFGGGLRSFSDIEQVLALGVDRVVLGTLALDARFSVSKAIKRFGSDKLAVGIDARDNKVRIRGWTEGKDIDPITLGRQLFSAGVKSVIYTNIARDGMGSGVDVQASRKLAQETKLSIIASGGVSTLADVVAVREAGLSGVIVGRALYEGHINLEEAISC